MIRAPEGHEIQVGDVVVTDKGPWGIDRKKVSRVTKKYAFCKYNDTAEGKFPRVYTGWDFESYPRQQWRMTTSWVEINPS